MKKPQTGYAHGRSKHFLNEDKNLQNAANGMIYGVTQRDGAVTHENESSLNFPPTDGGANISDTANSRNDESGIRSKLNALQTNRTEELRGGNSVVVSQEHQARVMRAHNQNQRLNVQRDIATAAAAMRLGYSG